MNARLLPAPVGLEPERRLRPVGLTIACLVGAIWVLLWGSPSVPAPVQEPVIEPVLEPGMRP